MSINKKVNLYTATFRDTFVALRNVYNHLQYKTVSDPNRNKHSVKILADMATLYVPTSNDHITTSPNGGVDLTKLKPEEWFHTKATWAAMGVLQSGLPDIVDQNGNPAMMTMNGIPIDITDLKVRGYIKKLSKYSQDVMMDALEEISKAIKLYFEEFGFTQSGQPFEVIQNSNVASYSDSSPEQDVR